MLALEFIFGSILLFIQSEYDKFIKISLIPKPTKIILPKTLCQMKNEIKFGIFNELGT
jgi:hypothetical protein